MSLAVSQPVGALAITGVAVAASDESLSPKALVALTRTAYCTLLVSLVMAWDREERSVTSWESAPDQSMSATSSDHVISSADRRFAISQAVSVV